MDFEEWMGPFDSLIGLNVSILSLVVLLIPLSFNIKLILLSISLMLIGFARMMNGFFRNYIVSQLQLLNIVEGALILVIAVISINYSASYQIAILTISIGLIINSVARIVFSFMSKKMPKWLKRFLGISGFSTGVVVILISFIITSNLNRVLILAVVSLINGLTRIVRGLIY